MRIAQSTLQMDSSRVAETSYEMSETITAWKGALPATGNESTASLNDTAALPSATVDISEEARNALLSQANIDPDRLAGTTSANAVQDTQGFEDTKLALIRALVERLTGRPLKLFDATSLQSANVAQSPFSSASPSQQSWGAEIQQVERYSDYEMTTFNASGTILTADGREISFNVELAMERSFYAENSTIVQAGGTFQDPLVLNFGGNAAELTDTRFAFDLDNDGTMENIHFATRGSGFLAIDRNADGEINNGSELFGPQTGSGFSELARLDTDGNGWIDEGDADWGKLRVWSKDESGADKLLTLGEANVGAISLDNIATLFSLMDTSNQARGEIRSTGIFLSETGGAGTIQHVDLAL